MHRVRVEAHAKINLGLAVMARRRDGYHDIDTVFQTVSLADGVTLESGGGAVSLDVSGIPVPGGAENLACRAAVAVREQRGCPGVRIRLEKRIPVGAGLGGGSADAAAVLVGMNELFKLGLSGADLEKLALSLGSDVPFLIGGGTAHGRGRGEKLEKLPALRGVCFVLVTPGFEVSAGDAYRWARIGLTQRGEFTKLRCSAIQEGNVRGLVQALRNDLEAGVVCVYPEVATVREALLETDVLGAVMSGSGPTVVGIADSEEVAEVVASRLSGRGWTIHVAEPIDAGCRIVGENRADEPDVQRGPETV